jgi:hypothetical protein
MSYGLDRNNSLTFPAIGSIDDVTFFNSDADNRFDNSRILGTAQRQYVSGFNPVFRNRSIEGETSLRADVVLKPSSRLRLQPCGILFKTLANTKE